MSSSWSTSRRPRPSADGGARGGPDLAAGNSWGEVLLHVASLPSSFSAAAAAGSNVRQHKAKSDSSVSASANLSVNGINAYTNSGAWRGGAMESERRHAERDWYLPPSSGGGSSGGQDVGDEVSSTEGLPASGRVTGGGGDDGVEVGAACSRQRRSTSGESLRCFDFFLIVAKESIFRERTFGKLKFEELSAG